MTDEQKEPVEIVRGTVRVKPHRYQPSKAELEEDISIDATPDELAHAILQPVRIVHDPDS